MEASLGADIHGFGFKLAAKLAFSHEKSVSAASDVQTSRSGSMTVVEVQI